MTDINSNLLAPCGLYCGVCAIHIADRDKNVKFKKILVDVYKPISKTPEDIKCSGCMSENQEEIFGYCKTCPIRDCVIGKGFNACYQCNDFPCKFIERFPIPVGKKVIMRAIPRWKEIGTEKWVEEEEIRYHCPDCGNFLFRGAKRCNKCGIPVDVD
ncbi:MAG: DUF3795 domain-containing protein [Promethearchaeota archaeon]|nr:MAG: DUF3795 domain-containing protein [Candidatus Lokiarchaeota archaeon]